MIYLINFISIHLKFVQNKTIITQLSNQYKNQRFTMILNNEKRINNISNKSS